MGKMEKILLKKVWIILSVLSIFVFALLSLVILSMENKKSVRDLNEMLSQIRDAYSYSQQELGVTKDLFVEDYLNRAYAIDFMIANNPKGNLNASALKKIKGLMEVESIHVIAHSGEIVMSSDKDSIGLNLKEHVESEAFAQLIDEEDPNAYVVQLDGISITKHESKTYIGVKSSLDKYAVIQIGLDGSTFDDLTSPYSISSLIRNTPTIRERAIFVVDRNTAEIVGITKNNEQLIEFENGETKEEYLSILENCREAKLININDKVRLLKTEKIDGHIIGAYADADMLYRSVLVDMACLFIYIVTMSISIFFIFKYYLKHYVLNDLAAIESNIKELMAGNKDVTFTTKHKTEFRYITAILNEWKDVYKYKSERMTRLISSIDSQAAVFECLYSINQNFYSNNTRTILGLQKEEWDKVIQSPKGFESYLQFLGTQAEDEIIALKNNRYIKVISFMKENEFYGMILDKTEDVKLKNKIQQELQIALKEAEVDPLTNLTNRAGLEKYVKSSLENEPGKGIMMICDLDNFKSVNDELGHPEGDKVLKRFAQLLKASFRENDVVARIGGDEFVVFLQSNLSVNQLADKIQCILKDVREELSDYHDRFGLSTSIGAAYVDKQENSYEDLYQCADVGLYIAKRLGKDGYYINEDHMRCLKDN